MQHTSYVCTVALGTAASAVHLDMWPHPSMCMDMRCSCVHRAQTNRMVECTLYMYVVCPLYVYHVALLRRYINTVIVVAEHVSSDRNPSETVWQNGTNHMHALKLHACIMQMDAMGQCSDDSIHLGIPFPCDHKVH